MTIPPFVDGEILYGAQLDAVVAEVNNKLSLDGGTVSGLTTYNAGLSTGTVFAATTKDLSKHLLLYGTTYGLNVTSNSLNLVAGGVALNYVSVFGLHGPIGANAPSTARFTTLEATGTVSGAGFTTLLAPYLKDAPNDANMYGRKGGAWSVVGGGSASDTAPLVDGTAAAGSSTTYSRGDHRHPTDTTRAPLADPVFTGNPRAPTPSNGDNDTSIATTAFVVDAVAPLITDIATVSDDLDTANATLTAHTTNKSNPHSTTAAQIGALPIGGGTLTGTLTVKGDVVVGSASDWFLAQQAGTGDHISAHTPTGDYDRWQASTGHRYWVANNEPIMFLDQLGNLNLDGALRSTTGVWASIADNSNGVYTSGGFKIWQVAADGWRQQFNATTHDWNFVNNSNATVLSISATGTVNTAGNVTATGNGVFGAYLQGSLLYGPNGVFVGAAGDSSFGMFKDTGGYKQQYVPDYHWWFDTTNGSTFYSATNAHAQLWFMRPSDLRSFNQAGPVGGNGAYENISDRRAKSAIEVSKDGLAEVMKLQPVQFTRVVKPRAEDATYPNGDPLPPLIPRREVGFIAQDVVTVLPHAVNVVGIELHDGSGTLEDKEPSLALTYDTITAALVNAVKEQQAMIDGLHARIKMLEGATP